MTTTNDAFKKAANSPAGRRTADTARSMRDDAADIASDIARKASKQFGRAQDIAAGAYEEAHEASKEYPHVTVALALGLGFLLGLLAASRR